MSNIFDAFDEQPSQQAWVNPFPDAQKKNPDAVAAGLKASRITGVDALLAAEKLPELAHETTQLKWEALARSSPKTAGFLQDPVAAAVSHDDVEGLSFVERTLRGLGGGFQEGVGMAVSGTGVLADIAQRRFVSGFSALFLPEARQGQGKPTTESLAGPLIGEGWRQTGGMTKEFARERTMVPAASQTFYDKVLGGIGQVGAQVATLPITRGAGLYAQGADAMDEKLKNDNPTAGQYDAAVLAGAAVTGITEKWALDKLLGPLDTGIKNATLAALTRIGIASASEGAQEFSENMLQDVIREVVVNDALNKPVGYLGDSLDVGQSLEEGGVGAAVGGVIRSMVEAGLHIRARGSAADKAEASAQFIDQVNQAATASKVLARDPETFQQFVKAAADDGPVTDVYIDAQVLNQSGLADQVMAASPAAAEQYQGALATGGQVRIPVDEYAARIAPQAYAQQLLDDLRLQPEDMTRREAQEYAQSGALQELEQAMARIIGDKAQSDTFTAGRDAVKQRVLDNLNTLGRFTSQKNELDATLIAARSATRAAQLGITPEQFFDQYVLNVVAEGAGGQVLNQGGKSSLGDVQAQWKKRLNAIARNDENFSPRLRTPAVLREMGVAQPELDFPVRAIRQVISKHRDLPGGIVFRLPELMSDPEFVIRHRDGGLNVVISERTPSGEPIVVGVREGRIRTITPIHNNEAESGAERLAAKIAADIQSGASVYRKNKAPDLTGASAPQQVRNNRDGLKNGANNNVLSRSDLVNKYGEGFYQSIEQTKRGWFNPATNTIALLKNADLSTFLHESGHYFFETDIALAAEILRENASFGTDTMSEGKQQILRDVSALLKWHGIEGDIASQVDQWSRMDFEERRAYHEKTAESFERYLMEGKAPSIELQSVFQTFRQWLVGVYKSIKDFLKRNPDAGELSDEVRAVFDRMLATEEEIKLAEQARSMLPLFADAVNAGMTPAEFAEYQKLGNEATQAAIDELQAKGIRDMKWLTGARSRMLKKLQKQAKAQRAEMRAAARADVMREPVYQAWNLLTSKMTDEDKLAGKKKRSEAVDPAVDSLFEAIAKMGGLNKETLVAQWGIDPKDKAESGLFSKPVMRAKDGGRSLDWMVEALTEEGYLTPDENGKGDVLELEERFKTELRGDRQYSSIRNWEPEPLPGEGQDLGGITAARIDRASLDGMEDLPQEVIDRLESLGMTARTGGIHPDVLSEILPGWTSGDELVRSLASAVPMKQAIEARTDQWMLEQYADMATPEAIERAADMAIHNDARERFLLAEHKALAKASGDKSQRQIVLSAARDFARQLIGRQRIRDIRPGQYAAAEARAAKAAATGKDMAQKTTEKRNQLLSAMAARESYRAQDDVAKGLRYLKKFDSPKIRKSVDGEYIDQILGILERFDLRKRSLKDIDRRKSLADWLTDQRAQGLEPDVSDDLKSEAFRKSYRDMTVEEFRGLLDAIRQIEHLGRLKNKLLTARKEKNFEKVRALLVAEVGNNQESLIVVNSEPSGMAERAIDKADGFLMAHIKGSSIIRVLDNGKDDGPWFSALLEPANRSADDKTEINRKLADELTDILKPVLKDTKFWQGLEVKGIDMSRIGIKGSLNLMQRMVVVMNMGNASNLQRLMGGFGWTQDQCVKIAETLTASQLRAVQRVWDMYEGLRPRIAEIEKLQRGVEPEWIDPLPFSVTSADGELVNLRGGYFKVTYDRKASVRADMLSEADAAGQAKAQAFSAATVRRSFTKGRVDEVNDRPLSLNLDGMFSGLAETAHYLAFANWAVDAQKIMRSRRIQDAIREKHGAQTLQELRAWVNDTISGDQTMIDGVGRLISWARTNVSLAGLAFNGMTGLLQLTGFLNGAVRNGWLWQVRGIAQLYRPFRMGREIRSLSRFMSMRMDTMFQELNEVANSLRSGISISGMVQRKGFFMIQIMQNAVDKATWWGAYQKALAERRDSETAVAIADQVVKDTQGSGLWHDLSAVQRNKYLKILTGFYGYQNTLLNTLFVQTKTAPTKRKAVHDALLLLLIIPAMTSVLRSVATPGGDDDEWELMRRILKESTGSAIGLFLGAREFSSLGNLWTGEPMTYGGSAAMRLVGDTYQAAEQARQGDIDPAFERAMINLMGDMTGLPSAQINKTMKGMRAMDEGETDSLLAPVFGYQD